MHTDNFNNIIHAPNRLQICAMLFTAAELEFKVLKDNLAVSDSVLSKHLKALQDEQYVKQEKRTKSGRPNTWLCLTNKGREAFSAHVKALKEIVGE
jgi:predicted ArsR family transcriptional regulator